MEIFEEQEELLTCPYNASHRIRRGRMAVHLVKCRKNYPDSRLGTCSFNETHRVPELELQYHHQSCLDKKPIEVSLYRESESDIDKFPVHKTAVTTNDSWDDYNVTSYNAENHCVQSDVVRRLDVANPSSRKNFRIGERHRITNIAAPPVQAERPLEKSTKSKKVFPKTPEFQPVDDQVPEYINDIIQRIKIDENQKFVPMQNLKKNEKREDKNAHC